MAVFAGCAKEARNSKSAIEMTMELIKTPLNGLFLISAIRQVDDRGEFVESWHHDRYRDCGIEDTFVQDNVSVSNPNVLRGLHFRHPEPQTQLVTVISGQIFDVCVDLRKNSKTFGRWHGVELNGSKKDQLYMPAGFAHGYCVIGHDQAVVHYKCSRLFDAESERGLLWNDPEVGVEWPKGNWIISERDQTFPKLGNIEGIGP